MLFSTRQCSKSHMGIVSAHALPQVCFAMHSCQYQQSSVYTCPSQHHIWFLLSLLHHHCAKEVKKRGCIGSRPAKAHMVAQKMLHGGLAPCSTLSLFSISAHTPAVVPAKDSHPQTDLVEEMPLQPLVGSTSQRHFKDALTSRNS